MSYLNKNKISSDFQYGLKTGFVICHRLMANYQYCLYLLTSPKPLILLTTLYFYKNDITMA